MKKHLADKRKGIGVQIVFSTIIVLAGFFWTFLSAYLLRTDIISLYRNLIFSALMSFVMIFSYLMLTKKKMLFFWNQGHFGRFAVVSILSFAFLIGMGQIPYLCAPISILSIILTLCSGNLCGLVAYCVMILQYALLQGLSVSQILVLLMAGFLGAMLFMGIDNGYRYVGGLFAYIVGEFVLYCLFFVMTQTGTMLGDAILYSAIRLFSALVIILIVLKTIGTYCVYKDVDFYAGINDPEYELLTQLKAVDKDAYFHAIHTAYLADKIARRIHCDAPLTKACGYYHKIGLLQGEDTIQNTILVGASYHFPQPLIRVLKEYGIKRMDHVSKEAAIVQFCDAMVSSVSYLQKKDAKAPLNYEKIVDVIIRKKIDSGDLEHCELTMEDLCEIKKGFVEERLYYDFLR